MDWQSSRKVFAFFSNFSLQNTSVKQQSLHSFKNKEVSNSIYEYRRKRYIKKVSRKKKLVTTLCFLLFLISISAFTNPTKEDYVKFDKVKTGVPMPENARIAEANYFLFSLYAPTPMKAVDEFGVVYLGLMGHFFQVSDGQYDDSIWKSFLK